MARPRSTTLIPLMASLFLSTASCFHLPILPSPSPFPVLRTKAQLQPPSMALDATELSKKDVKDLGLTEWPSIVRKGTFSETLKDGAVWYILEGSATVKSKGRERPVDAVPGTLIEASGCDEHMEVEVSGGDELLILTPSYQEGRLFAGALVFLVLGSAALFAISSNMN